MKFSTEYEKKVVKNRFLPLCSHSFFRGFISLLNFFMYFREKDLGIFYVTIVLYKMGDNLVPKSADTIDTLLHHDISSQNNTTSNVELLPISTHGYNGVTYGDNLVPKSAGNFYCEKCDFICSKQSNWNRHIFTLKHQNKHRQGLSRHKKKCIGVPEAHDPSPQQQQQPHHANSDTSNPELVEKMFTMFTQMMTHNQDFMQNVIGKVQGINTNSHNNTQFNINMFLNEQCKNAMNIGDFIKSLPITAQDYENTKDNGLADTLTNLMVDGLNSMEHVERPIHCTDQKRKVMYVKDNDKWEKDKDNALFLQGVHELADIHKKRVHLWQQDNPEFKTREKLQAVFTSIIGNLFTDVTEQRKDMNKIFKGVTDSTFLDDNTKNTLASH